ncbi:MarR family winged helix-turn-helix transcriptional regulator [Salipaludibacillus keqinensis]|uniref:MarR family winged helix-turn-helix transcriptional regulator n=1 Tax=Salipaludibacillus keqinensis TaxID=2045207 RepID=UPI001304BD0A|nr:MarR family transcriptional regulator [Salipaludibacillus keqinensis]
MDINKIICEIEERLVDISLTFNREFGTGYENSLSSNQQLMLFLVAKKNVKHVKDLAYHMNVSASAISQMVAKLEQMDIIYREIDESNRRSTVLKMGKTGLDLLKKIDENRSEITNKYLSKMNEQDLVEIRDAFKKLHQIVIETERGDQS